MTVRNYTLLAVALIAFVTAAPAQPPGKKGKPGTEDKATKPLTEDDAKQAVVDSYKQANREYKGVDVVILDGPIDPSPDARLGSKNPALKAYYVTASPWKEPGKPLVTHRKLVLISRVELKFLDTYGQPVVAGEYDESDDKNIAKRFGADWVKAHPFPKKK